MRNTAEKRHNDWKKALRKKRIINAYGYDLYDNLHQYSKNKVHCSCPLCRAKTSKRYKLYGHGGTGGKHWSATDQKKIDEMENQLFDNE